jgi:hypothetical protein
MFGPTLKGSCNARVHKEYDIPIALNASNMVRIWRALLEQQTLYLAAWRFGQSTDKFNLPRVLVPGKVLFDEVY